MRHKSKTMLLITAAITGAAGMLIFVNAPVAAQTERGGATYRATLSPLPGTSGHGQATLTQTGQSLRVHITASGLEPGVHISHIHGLSNGGRAVNSTCPTLAQDTDGDGFVELGEGAATYGPILVDFMNNDPNQDGSIDFTTTIPLTAEVTPLNMRHIVIHGMTVGAVGAGTPGEVNGQAGYKTVLPVLCGEIGNGANGNAMVFRKSGS